MAWLLLRGLTREQRHWGGFARALAERTGEPAHMLDLPGVGTERHRPSPSRIRDITADLRARFVELAAREGARFDLVAISLGGMVALEWLSRWPKDFGRGVVMNTSAADLSPPWARMRPAVVPLLAQKLRAKDQVAAELAVLAATTSDHGGDRGLAEAWASYAQEAPPHRGAALAQITAAMIYRAPRAVQVPLLVLAAQGDRLCASSCGRALADRYRASYAEHPTAGHDLPLDDPGWVLDQIERFRSAVGKAA